MLKANFFWPSLREKLFVPIRTLHIDFRRPLRRFQKFQVRSRILAVDKRNIFLAQAIHSDSKPVAIAFMNSIIKKGRETMNPIDLMKRFQIEIDDSKELKTFCQNFQGSQTEFDRINEILSQL